MGVRVNYLVVALALVLSLSVAGQPAGGERNLPAASPVPTGPQVAQALAPPGVGPATLCSTTPCANGAPITWYTGSPWGSTQLYSLPSRDDGERFGTTPGDSICPGNITTNPTNVMASSTSVCFVGMQTFPIYFATSPASGNLLAGQYTMNIGSDDGSSLYLDSLPSIGPGALETTTSYNMVVGSPAGGGYGSPSSWSSNNGNLVSATDGGFSYIHVAYEECCGGPYALSYWFYTNQSDPFGSGMVSQRGVGPGPTQTYFPQAVLTGSVYCDCNGVVRPFPNIPVTIQANYGTGWTYPLHTSSAGDYGFDIPPSEFVGKVSDPYTLSITPPQGYVVSGATVNGSAAALPVQTSVGPGFADTVNFYMEPLLNGVTVTPPNASLLPLSTQTFTANATCVGGTSCPSGTLYSWSLTNGLGTLNSTTGSSVTFTAGTADGNVTLFANATLFGSSVSGAPVPIDIHGVSMTSVTVNPPSVALGYAATQNFTVNVTCTATCPATTLSWSLTNRSLGSLNVTQGPSVSFTANTTAGSLGLFANATINGTTVQSAPAMITISGSTLSAVVVSPPTSQLSGGGTQAFTATPACTASCPSGISFAWTLSNSTLGNLSRSSGASVTFTAGSLAGTDHLFVNATLYGSTVSSAPAVITLTGPSVTLNSVLITPLAPTVAPLGMVSLHATPACSASCPPGITYAWALANSGMGTLNTTVGPGVAFSAGTTVGAVRLFVNATLLGTTRESSTWISVTPPSTLDSVAITPATPALPPATTLPFQATPTCSLACPAGVAYTWALSDPTLGHLNSSGGAQVSFTAGTAPGTIRLSVNATLGGITRGGSTWITITGLSQVTLSSVTITPGGITLVSGGTQAFSPVPVCGSGGRNASCPATGVTYTWSVNSIDGSLAPITGDSTTFTAGNSSGSVDIQVTATLGGVSVQGSTPVTIVAHSSAPPPAGGGTTSGLPGSDYALLLAVAGATLFVVFVVLRRRRRSTAEWTEGPTEAYPPAQ